MAGKATSPARALQFDPPAHRLARALTLASALSRAPAWRHSCSGSLRPPRLSARAEAHPATVGLHFRSPDRCLGAPGSWRAARTAAAKIGTLTPGPPDHAGCCSCTTDISSLASGCDGSRAARGGHMTITRRAVLKSMTATSAPAAASRLGTLPWPRPNPCKLGISRPAHGHRGQPRHQRPQGHRVGGGKIHASGGVAGRPIELLG